MRTFLRFGTCSALVLSALGCGSSTLTPDMEMTSAVIGANGGMVKSSDGALQVVIPAAALTSDVTVTIEPTTSPGSGSIGTVYEIGPTGTQFATPVTLTLDYGGANLGGTNPSMLRVATFAGGSWQILSGAAVDTQAQTVSGTTTHLSPYALTSATTGAMCATVSGGASCSGGTIDTGGGSGAAGTTGAGAASGGTTTSTCTPSTCAEATNPCAAYPGATMSSCTDGPNGYMATCCFPSGGPICLASAGGTATCSEDCSVGGSCTTTCPPAPTCATATTATACGSLTGSTLQSCVDGTSGYTAACCFAPGAPVCTTVSAGQSCGGSTDGTTTCAPAPTCADGNPCTGLAGATMQSCTDSADGYTAVCCLLVGEVPSSGGGSSVSTGGGVGGGTGTGSGTAGAGGASSGSGGVSATGTGGLGGASSSGTGDSAVAAASTPALAGRRAAPVVTRRRPASAAWAAWAA